ncbi:hypothetical protein [Enhygromyxa salina]|uniref:hypothetical protein n=1 Tax=Enhygromyxa salina TaxID=215803 RepID=UPI000D03EFB5|nr:hypothetical protein [Enhygromyxa salina]
MDDLDESTRPYTHAQIDDMRKLVASGRQGGSGPVPRREFKVNLERFAHFGEAGTPAGMITCRSSASVVGSCGAGVEGVPERALLRAPSRSLSGAPIVSPQAEGLGTEGWGPPAPGVDDDGVPVARVGELEWAPTLAYGAAAPESSDVEMPTATLGLPGRELAAPVAVREREDSAEQVDEQPQPASRKKWAVGVGLVLGLVLVGVGWVAGRGEPEPAAVVVQEPVAVSEESQPSPAPPERVAPSELVEVLQVEPPPAEQIEPEQVVEEPAPVVARERKAQPHEGKQCVDTREQTVNATTAGDWNLVMTLTSKSKCWSKADKVDLQAARMIALFELQRSGECVKVGQGSSHPRIVTLRKRCTLAQR